MSVPKLKRPKRLWVAAIMNIVAGLAGLFLTAFVLISSRAPDELRFGAGFAMLAVVTASFLVASSVLALLGKPRWDWLMLVAAVVCYGGVLAQNTYLLVQMQEVVVPTQKLVANVVRSGLEIAINLWAVLSAKTRAYFRSTPAASQ